jgi:hypothetical protein
VSKFHATAPAATTGTVAATSGPVQAIRRIEMKILMAFLLLIVASSQFACRPLVAGGVGAAVGVAAERERQEDKDKDGD